MWRRFTTAIAVSLVVPALAFAQAAPSPGPAAPAPGAAPQPAPMSGGVLNHILNQLNLSADQRASINGILAAQRQNGEAARQQMLAARQVLMQAINADVFNEAKVREAANAMSALEADRAVATARLLHDVRAVLTPEQQAQLQQALRQPPPRGPRPQG
jgi:Spy/CpxP family protein refolding chaperone